VLDGIGSAPVVVTAEEHRRAGGLGSVVLEALNDAGVRRISIVRLGLPDAFVTGYGTHADSLLGAGLSIEGLEVAAREVLEAR
jgi:transketolase C-terminal domain/subunit